MLAASRDPVIKSYLPDLSTGRKWDTNKVRDAMFKL